MTLDPRKVFILSIIIGALFLVQSFVIPAIWAGIVFIGIYPFYDFYNKKFFLKSQRIRNYIFFTFLTVFLIFVFYALFSVVVKEVTFLIKEVNSIRSVGWVVPENFKNIPYVGEAVFQFLKNKFNNSEKIDFFLKTIDYDLIISYAKNIGLFTIEFLFKFFIFLLSFLFLLMNQEFSKNVIYNIVIEVFGKEKTDSIANDFNSGIRSIFNNIIIISVTEAVILFPIYAYFGAPHAALLAILTGVVSIIPGLAQVIIIIISAHSFIFNSTQSSIIILSSALLVNSLFDNFIRPYLIKRSINLPISLVILGIIGGIQLWGILGIFLGPIIMGFLNLVVIELIKVEEVK